MRQFLIQTFTADVTLNETGATREYWDRDVGFIEVRRYKSKVESTTIDKYGKVDVQEYPKFYTGGSPTSPNIPFSMKVTTNNGKVATYKVQKVDNTKKHINFFIKNQEINTPLTIGKLDNVTIEIYSTTAEPIARHFNLNANYDAQLKSLQLEPPEGQIQFVFNVNNSNPIYLTGENKDGNKQQMIANVKSVTIKDDNSVNLQLSNKRLKAKGKAAKKAVKGFDSGEYNNMTIFKWWSKSEEDAPHVIAYPCKLRKSKKQGLAKLEFEKTSERTITFNDETQTVGSISQKKYFEDLKEKLEQSSDLKIICKPSNSDAISGKLCEINIINDVWGVILNDVWKVGEERLLPL
jgi:hypothetical protein